ncbi:MAG: penicillin-binding protein activator [Alphaproteobacteria bacterium]|nr:MAG: penicillin-binding protein activator [Alphaproteobacteria bacterium]
MRTSFMTLVILTALTVSACIPTNRDRRVESNSPFDPYNQTIITDGQTFKTMQGDGQHLLHGTPQNQPYQQVAKGKIALLLPLTGKHQKIGQALLQSSQLALFDINQSGIELIPLDTKGTAQGASAAVEQAAQSGAKIILGPLFADAVSAAGQAAKRHNLTVIGFTTDWNKAGGNIFTMGILPFDQGARLAQYAATKNKKRVAILSPNTKYSNAVISSFEQSARAYGITVTHKIAIGKTTAAIKQNLSALNAQATQFDAILIPTGNPTLSLIANALNDVGLNASTKTWLGTGVWDDDTIKRNAAMENAVFAAPTPALRYNFERSYQSLYGAKPPRLASLSYDATALAITLLSQNRDIQGQAILNPNGFSGIDGIFRFQSNGLTQRGLAIHRISNSGRSMIVDQAPNSFLTSRGDFASR